MCAGSVTSVLKRSGAAGQTPPSRRDVKDGSALRNLDEGHASTFSTEKTDSWVAPELAEPPAPDSMSDEVLSDFENIKRCVDDALIFDDDLELYSSSLSFRVKE